MQRESKPPSDTQDAPRAVSRRAMLGTAGFAAGAALLGSAARTAEAEPKREVVPAPAYAPTPYSPEIDLTGKNIVITGASRGLGRATALELLSAGANVWGTSRTPAAYPEVTEYPLLTLDLEDAASIGAFVPTIGAATGGRVDVLINNAGRFVFGSTTPLTGDPAEFALWSTNSALGLQTLYLGHRMLTFAMLGLMQHSGYRRIMFTASAAAYASGADVGSQFYQPYVAGKRAILDFANSLRAWFGMIGADIGVGTVNPANTRSDLARGTRPIFTEPVDVDGNPAPSSPLSFFLPLVRQAADNGQPPEVVGRAYRQALELQFPHPNVLAVIPDGPNSTADAALLPLFLATRAKEEQEFGAIPWAIAKVK